MRTIRLFFSCLLLFVFSCNSSKHLSFRIGVDPYWYPLNFEVFQPYVNGFTEELLLELSEYTGASFLKLESNWDSLLQGLQEKLYDGILTSLPPLSSHQAKYDVSSSFLPLGPALVVSLHSPWHSLSDLANEIVGVLSDDPAILTLQKYPEMVVRKYETAPELLQALFSGSIQGAVLDRLAALSFVRNLYAGQLKISTDPLATTGLHLVCLKGAHPQLLDAFERGLSRLQKQNKLQDLQAKWQL